MIPQQGTAKPAGRQVILTEQLAQQILSQIEPTYFHYCQLLELDPAKPNHEGARGLADVIAGITLIATGENQTWIKRSQT
jgi:hypothetical protein